jgi:hypothetical protein
MRKNVGVAGRMPHPAGCRAAAPQRAGSSPERRTQPRYRRTTRASHGPDIRQHLPTEGTPGQCRVHHDIRQSRSEMLSWVTDDLISFQVALIFESAALA